VPRNFVIDPRGQFLLAANQKSGSIVVFKINSESGELTPTGSKIEVAAPVCLRFFTPAK
jgi:6-phosphogluconolactonase